MSDSEEYVSNFYGTPLEPYDEDAFPKKRPITVEDQVAKDAQGRRRFHGAFTGGFSAGFFNTVGSLEGWTPNEFKSSRSEKANNVVQKPTDFMDDEDLGEFGIAPQVIQATKDYSQSKKRKIKSSSSGPIPGQPVLQTFIESVNETVGYYILKNMTVKEKKLIKQEMEEITEKVYGCEMPKEIQFDKIPEIFKETYEIPDIYLKYLMNSKSNTVGLGHTGLNPNQENPLFKSVFTMRDKNNKKISISGQAFGVGAFEDDDEDIYTKDDMSRYDFEMTSEKVDRKKEIGAIGEFIKMKMSRIFKNDFPPPVVPASFTGIYNVRKSRFEPVLNQKKILGKITRKDINAKIRANFLDDNPEIEKKNIEDIKAKKDSDFLNEKFVSENKEDCNVEKYPEIPHGTKEMCSAVRLKLFGPLTRKTSIWKPCSLLCKRFNVPELQFKDDVNLPKKRTKNLIFEYQQHVEETPSISGLNTTDSNLEKIEDNSEKRVIVEETECNEEEPTDIKVETSENIQKSLNYNEKIDVSKQIDLFKAIFLSSSESENEDEHEEQEEKKIEDEQRLKKIKEDLLSESSTLPKIKATVSGILSNIDFLKINQVKINDSTVVKSLEIENSSTSYGPKLPESDVYQIKIKTNNVDNIKVLNSEEEWVEKNPDKDRKKHKKKKKKHKSKRK